jgi:hypothetical protein
MRATGRNSAPPPTTHRAADVHAAIYDALRLCKDI